MNVRPHGVRRVVTALKFIEHQLAKMSHRGILLVTHTLDPATARAYHNCSIRRASGFVQTRFSSSKRLRQ